MFSRFASAAVVVAIVGCFGCCASAAETIRVGLRYGDRAPTALTISGRGEGRANRSHGGFDGEVRVTVEGRDIVLEHRGHRVPVGDSVEFWASGDDPWIELDGYAYRSKLRIELQRNRRLRAINILDVEDYVRGVVPNEMFSDPEAFKVQAVISRTLAFYVRDVEGKHRKDGFDICSTGHCQVYRGVDSERPLSDAAVAATRGQVLTYRGKPIFSAYHANSGGLTQTVDEAWPGSIGRNFPYLACVESPYDRQALGLPGYAWCYQWDRVLSPEEIGERLRQHGHDVGEVKDVTVRHRTSTGRVQELGVVGSRGEARLGKPSEVRAVLDTPSAFLDIERDARGFVITGRGRGHGVGLSQHGALGMAKAGYSYEEILAHFYRDVALTEDCGRGESRQLSAPELKADASDEHVRDVG
jgi:stage II sporulation protein D